MSIDKDTESENAVFLVFYLLMDGWVMFSNILAQLRHLMS